MSRRNYKWLFVVEGNTDRSTYEGLMSRFGISRNDFCIVKGGGKYRLCNTAQWECNPCLWGSLTNDLGRSDFIGIILFADSDTDYKPVFGGYERNSNLRYVEQVQSKIQYEHFWQLDMLDGVRHIPILGIAVPTGSNGCLETVLLESYGIPLEGQTEYTSLVEIIKRVSNEWRVSKLDNDKDWWEDNTKAKMDKFILAFVLQRGFRVSDVRPVEPDEPDTIKRIKVAMQQY